MNKKMIIWTVTAAISIAGNAGGARRPARQSGGQASWRYYSTERGNIPQPNAGSQQTASLVLDIDKDGTDDFVITERTETPSVVWYKYKGDGNWARFVIDDTHLRIEAGGDYFDIDGDGDLDIVFGGDAGSNQAILDGRGARLVLDETLGSVAPRRSCLPVG